MSKLGINDKILKVDSRMMSRLELLDASSLIVKTLILTGDSADSTARELYDSAAGALVLDVLDVHGKWFGKQRCPMCRGDASLRKFDYCSLGMMTVTYSYRDVGWAFWERFCKAMCAQHFSFIMFGENRRRERSGAGDYLGAHLHGVLYGWQCCMSEWNRYMASVTKNGSKGNFKMSRFHNCGMPDSNRSKSYGIDAFAGYSSKHHFKQHKNADMGQLPIYLNRKHGPSRDLEIL